MLPLQLVCGVLLSWVTALPAQPVATPAAPALGGTLTAPVLTNVEQVHGLSRKEAAAGRPVCLRGVITCSLPAYRGAVVQDASGGIYFDLWTPPLGSPPPVGELVELEGVTDPGQFAPQIRALKLTSLGKQELPPPVRPYWDQLINGSLDTEYVEIEGVVTAAREDGVILLTHGGKIEAQLFDADGGTNNLAFKRYEGALVRLRGCLFAAWDPATHQVNVTQVRLFAPASEVVEPAPVDPYAIAAKAVLDLLRFDPQASVLRRVKVNGQIVHGRDHEYYAMAGTNGFRFLCPTVLELEAGDLVEVVGFPNLTGPSPVLQEALARKVGSAPLPAVRSLEAKNLFRAENDAVRVRVKALLLNVSADHRRLELQAGLQRFVALLGEQLGEREGRNAGPRAGPASALDLPPGSQLELTGVYAGSGGNRTSGTEVANFELLLNSPADIQVLTRPPFWTLPRLLILVGALLALLGLALVWIRLLHHRVQQRTVQLQKEVLEREIAEHQRALAQERSRIARDLHDDLGTSLTEICMLATASPGQELAAEEATERMEMIAGKSRSLVYAMDEIVWAVDPERDTLGSVARYLASYAEEYLAGLKVACRVQIPNAFPALGFTGEVRHHLFLAVKEALNNAVRHGNPSEVGFRVRVLEDQLWIAITDNGSGFDARGPSEGHGLANLRKRLEHLHGRCELESSPGAGTTVCLQLPLPVPETLP